MIEHYSFGKFRKPYGLPTPNMGWKDKFTCSSGAHQEIFIIYLMSYMFRDFFFLSIISLPTVLAIHFSHPLLHPKHIPRENSVILLLVNLHIKRPRLDIQDLYEFCKLISDKSTFYETFSGQIRQNRQCFLFSSIFP